MTRTRAGVTVDDVSVAAYRIPTESPESDGTFEWSATTCVVVHVAGGGARGLGYTYADAATAGLVRSLLAPAVRGCDALDVTAAHAAMQRAVRNNGRMGLTAMALSAVDVALWDLKARLLGVSLLQLLGAARPAVPAYGSGGFTSYALDELAAHMRRYRERGFAMVKMKVGRAPDHDVERVRRVREAVGDECGLFVDANGAWTARQALAFAAAFADHGVSWLEEPVVAEQVGDLSLIRAQAPPAMDVAAGEYGYTLADYRRLEGAVDVLQADVTRCGGVSGFLAVDALCRAAGIPLSTHCAPAVSATVACAAPSIRHLEYFHDHERVEAMLFDGAPVVSRGSLAPDPSRAGHGLALKAADAGAWLIADDDDGGGG